jgi:hypothetical protein
MNNQYYVSIVVILILLTYAMFCQDALTEYFENNEQIGQCMNLYSKSLLKNAGIKIINNPGQRRNNNCPSPICQYDTTENKCIPSQQNTTSQAIHDYCEKEQYMENITEMDLCRKMGYTWDNGECNPSPKRTEDQCPQTVCDWNSDTKNCEPKPGEGLYSIGDYDSVSDYCGHLKSLTPLVDKQTCNNMGDTYDWNGLVNKCINVDINSQNINDKCWEKQTQNNCLNPLSTEENPNEQNCVWIPNLSKVLNADDIRGLRVTELEALEKEINGLDTKLDTYLNSVGPYQHKMDTEQAAALVIKITEKDDKDRYQFEKGIRDYKKAYNASM